MAVRGAVAGGAAHGRRYIRSASARNSLRLELQIVIIRFADQQNTLQSNYLRRRRPRRREPRPFIGLFHFSLIFRARRTVLLNVRAMNPYFSVSARALTWASVPRHRVIRPLGNAMPLEAVLFTEERECRS